MSSPKRKDLTKFSEYNNHLGTQVQTAVVKRIVKNAPFSRMSMKGVWYEGDNHEYQVACDGYHAIRTLYHTDVEDAPDGERISISKILDDWQLIDGEFLSLPTAKEIKDYIRTTDNKNPDHHRQIFYDFDDEHRVNACYLRDLIDCLDNPMCWYLGAHKYYLKGTNGDGLLMGIQKPNKKDEDEDEEGEGEEE